MSPVIDFSDVKALEPIPEGEYSLLVTKATAGEAKSGAPKVDVQWKVQEGEFENRIVFDTLSFHEKALWRTKLALTALNIDASGEINTDELPELLLGMSAVVKVGIQESDPSQINPETGEPYPARNKIAKIVSV